MPQKLCGKLKLGDEVRRIAAQISEIELINAGSESDGDSESEEEGEDDDDEDDEDDDDSSIDESEDD